MRVMIDVRHPSQVHHFRNFASQMAARGHEVMFMAVEKEMVTDLLTRFGLPFEKIGTNRQGLAGKAASQLGYNWSAYRLARRFKPDLIVGRPTPTAAITGWVSGVPSLVFAENDLKTVPLVRLTAFPFAASILAPEATDLGKYNARAITYRGNHKLAYLHPAYFTPDPSAVEKYLGGSKDFAVIRLTSMRAHHDIGRKGMSDEVLIAALDLLKQKCDVFIHSERPLLPEFEQYRLQIPSTAIHDVLSQARLFLSDSGSMTMEAGVIGTPAVYFSDFAGEINVIEELDHKYHLIRSISTDQPDKMLEALRELLAYDLASLRSTWQARKENLLQNMINVTDFMVWFAEEYPESESTMRSMPETQLRFR